MPGGWWPGAVRVLVRTINVAPPLFGTISAPVWPDDMPPWHVISTRELARLLGVGVQVLGEWRARSIGPTPEPEGIYRRGQGNKRWYRINEIMRWYDSLQGIDRQPWEYEKDFLKRSLRIEENLSEPQVEYLKKTDWTGMIPDFPQPQKIRYPCMK